MATTTTITKLLFRRGNDTDRQQTIFASGEPAWALNTGRLWIGDGATPGGLPALSAADYHLRYTDASGDPAGANTRQRLDINVPGLSATLVGDRPVQGTQTFGRMFHGVDRVINSNYPLEITGLHTDTDSPDILYTGPGSKTFYIDRANNGLINIGNALTINTATNEVHLDMDELNFQAATQTFANGNITLFEDKTIDINVPIDENGTPYAVGTPEAAAVKADSAGFYFSHMGYTSAGRFAVSELKSQEGWSTFWLAPPVYDTNWDTGGTATRLDRSAATTNDWVGWSDVPLNVEGGVQQYGSKPIAIKSARPGNKDSDGYTGYADLVLETGLIVYGPGDSDLTDWNGYMINQSLDTGAKPKFSGIEIPAGGEPIGLASGGTGVNTLPANGILASNETNPTGPIRSLVLQPGELITGTNTGINVTTMNSDSWLAWTNDPTTGQLTVTNKFSPNKAYGVNWSSDNETKTTYFDKWYQINTETGNLSPNEAQTQFTIVGDDEIGVTGDKRRLTPDATNDIHTRNDSRNISIIHAYHANTLYNDGETVRSNNIGTAWAGINAYTDESVANVPVGFRDTHEQGHKISGNVLSKISFNRSGHIRDIASKNLDERYVQVYNVGTKDHRESGEVRASIFTPDDFNANTDGTALNVPSITAPTGTGINESDTQHPLIINNVVFNDYGTVKSYTTYDLGDCYYNKQQIGDAISAIQTSLESLGNSALKRDTNTNTITTNAIETGWLASGKVRFGNSSSKNSTIYENENALEIQAGVMTATGQTRDLRLYAGQNKTVTIAVDGGTTPVATFDTDDTILHTGGQVVLTVNSAGATLASGKFIGTATQSDMAYKINVTPQSSAESYHYLVFTNEYTGVESPRCHASLNYYPKTKTLGGVNLAFTNGTFTGDVNTKNLKATGTITGNGSGLTSIPESAIVVSGTGGSFVKTQGNQTIDGIKTFNKEIRCKADVIAFYSDERLKNVEGKITEPLEKIQAMSGYYYKPNEIAKDLIQDDDDSTRVGVLAQEVERVLPEVVKQSPVGDDYKTVQYEKLVPVLIEGIKELTSRVAELEAELQNR